MPEQQPPVWRKAFTQAVLWRNATDRDRACDEVIDYDNLIMSWDKSNNRSNLTLGERIFIGDIPLHLSDEEAEEIRARHRIEIVGAWIADLYETGVEIRGFMLVRKPLSPDDAPQYSYAPCIVFLTVPGTGWDGNPEEQVPDRLAQMRERIQGGPITPKTTCGLHTITGDIACVLPPGHTVMHQGGSPQVAWRDTQEEQALQQPEPPAWDRNSLRDAVERVTGDKVMLSPQSPVEMAKVIHALADRLEVLEHNQITLLQRPVCKCGPVA